jgi:putative peptide zinc metalloprotease protein
VKNKLSRFQLPQEMHNPEAVKPVLAGPLGAWELFPGTQVLGIRELDRYMQAPSRKAGALTRALSLMDGEHTLEQISASMRSVGIAIDVEGLYRKAAGAGLVAGIPFAGDMSRISLRLLEINIEPFFRRANWIRKVYPFLAYLPLLAAAGAAITLFYSGISLLHLGFPKVWRPIGPGQWIAVLAGALLSILLHEGAHAVTASRYGLAPSRVRLLGYLGFIPYLVLSIPGLYTVPPRMRLKIWAAGPLGSLMAASVAQIAAFASPAGFAHLCLSTLAQVNLFVAIWNLCPLVPTDGYFILCTLVRSHNLRFHAWSAIADVFRMRRTPSIVFLLFGISSIALLAILWQRNVSRILYFFSHSVLGYGVIAAVTILLIVRQVLLATARKSAIGAALGSKS